MDAQALRSAPARGRRAAAKAGDGPVGALLARIAQEYDALPPKLASVARYVERHRASLMVDRVTEVAERCGVQPSAVVRFAQRFGYSGFSELQAVFRAQWSERAAPQATYQQRIRRMVADKRGALTPGAVAREFVAASASGLDELARDFDDAAFAAAVGLLERAQHIYVVGVRRSYPVAAYITYALQHVDKRVQLVDGTGGMVMEQVRSIGRQDAIVAISFTPYGKETLACVRHAHRRGAKAIVLTDSRMSPLARVADALLVVPEGSAFAFRSLTNTLCLGQALFVALAYRLESKIEETRDRGDYDD
ncbi:MAG: MurR/RpiR family transcriptional regulator [Betaproteobacteria bacterium]|jgi:DNA-binding MurR/RpiR family transcriptional regulator|nr:MurR/RpiR family transcriptional regulator [Betaproteobacteria bacterium]MDH5288110.1 MurR/RpiR family transcriptional regulator [Betaproteobacteria bacterium]